jgi:dihydrofolate reductase
MSSRPHRRQSGMRKLIVSEFVTLDGVMEAPGGEPTHPHTGWVMDYQGPEQEQYKLDEVLEAETLLVGRVTYESFAGAWPTYEGVFADRMNGMPKVVVSSTLTDPEWNNTTVLQGDLVDGVTELKKQDGGPILVAGSKTLVHTLLDDDLVDELRLMVFPVTIGAGLHVFPDTVRKRAWSRTDSVTFPSGVWVDTYHPA